MPLVKLDRWWDKNKTMLKYRSIGIAILIFVLIPWALGLNLYLKWIFKLIF
ncbi:MAG: hypothetical protein ACFFG0_01350 [Candidatus Thorarchaeota archaeon]